MRVFLDFVTALCVCFSSFGAKSLVGDALSRFGVQVFSLRSFSESFSIWDFVALHIAEKETDTPIGAEWRCAEDQMG